MHTKVRVLPFSFPTMNVVFVISILEFAPQYQNRQKNSLHFTGTNICLERTLSFFHSAQMLRREPQPLQRREAISSKDISLCLLTFSI